MPAGRILPIALTRLWRERGLPFQYLGAEMQSDDFEIRTIRQAIAEDWSTLASNNLSAERRRAVREHLEINVSALRDFLERNRIEKQKAKLRQSAERGWPPKS